MISITCNGAEAASSLRTLADALEEAGTTVFLYKFTHTEPVSDDPPGMMLLGETVVIQAGHVNLDTLRGDLNA